MEMYLIGLSSKENEEPAESIMRRGHCQEFTMEVHDLKFLWGIRISIRVQEQALPGMLLPHTPTPENLSWVTNMRKVFP